MIIYLPFWLGIASYILAIALFIPRLNDMGRMLFKALLTCIGVALGGITYINWTFRDGLGHDSVTSSGPVAWDRFWDQEIPAVEFLVPPLILGVIGIIVSRMRQAKKTRANKAPQPER